MKCWIPFPGYAVGEDRAATCPFCGTLSEMYLFPALAATSSVLTQQQMELAEGAASCFYHQTKQAEVSCGQCGKFLCALCSLEIGTQVWCGDCLSAGSDKKSIPAMEGRRTLWDSIALGLALGPLIFILFVYFWILTAPAAIFVSLKYWRRPTSLLPRTKARFVFAMLIAVLQLAGWGLLLMGVMTAFRQRS